MLTLTLAHLQQQHRFDLVTRHQLRVAPRSLFRTYPRLYRPPEPGTHTISRIAERDT